jgi:hypothetical protein
MPEAALYPIIAIRLSRALACAALLREGRPGRPRYLRVAARDSGAILLPNVYGWFERTERGVHRLSSLGESASGAGLPEPSLPRSDESCA